MEIRALNTLRGVAALMVVISHYSTGIKLFDGVLGNAKQLGVMLFFILSGFLMAYLYLNQPFNYRKVKRFVVAHFARVMPLFVLLMLLSWLLTESRFQRHLYPTGSGYKLV